MRIKQGEAQGEPPGQQPDRMQKPERKENSGGTRQAFGKISNRSGSLRQGAERGQVVKGIALLGGTAMLVKAMGTLQKIPLQNLAGDRVFGIYNAVYPIYQIFLSLAVSGVPVALSIVIARRVAAGDDRGRELALRAAIWLMVLGGGAGFVLLWQLAPVLAVWLGDSAALGAIRAAACGLWFLPLAAVLRGYFQGLQTMRPTALSQVVEQGVRVVVMLALLGVGLAAGWSETGLAAGAMAGAAVGGAAALLLLVILWARHRQRAVAGQDSVRVGQGHVVTDAGRAVRDAGGAVTDAGRAVRDAGGAVRDAGRAVRDAKAARASTLVREAAALARLALPVMLGALAVPAAALVDALTVPVLLRQAGLSSVEAMTQFGLYSRGLPLVQLVTMAAAAAAGALVPAMTAAWQRGDRPAAGQAAELALRLAWWLGAASSVGLVLLAAPINVMLYSDAQASGTLALVGAGAAAGTLSAVFAALLPALGAVRLPALLLLLAAALKAALNAALVPALGIAGAAVAGLAAFGAAALLGVAALRRNAGVRLPAKRYVAGPALALACMAAALLLFERGASALLVWLSLPLRGAATVLALTGVAVGAGVFAAVLLRSGGIGAREWRALPGGRRWVVRLRRWGLLKGR